MLKARGVACVLFFYALAWIRGSTAQRIPVVADAGNKIPGPSRLVPRMVAKTNTSRIAKAKEPVFSQMELDAMLINATKKNNLEGVEKYLEMGADLNLTTGIVKRTLLHIAAKTGGPELVEFLIEAGIPVDTLTIGLATPLHVAAADDRVEAAGLLLENGADKSATTRDGNSPLHWAATQGHPEVAKLLLEYEADRTALNAEGEIPIEILCCCECGEDSNCSCEDREALVWLLDFSQRGNTSLVLDGNSEETEIETILALEDFDSSGVPDETEADPPISN